MSDAYDYVVVGAGSAGCVLAHRLTTEPDVDVLLLEAGPPDEKEAIPVPSRTGELMRSEVDWDYATEPQPEMAGRRLYWPRGKTLGGSSSINAMLYVRGHRWDYDRWADLGNEGWSYDDLLPYFRRSEDFEGGASEFHGVGGPLRVSRREADTQIDRVLLDAAVEAGIPRIEDFNGPRQEGSGRYHVTVKEGERHSTAAAYLKPVLDRPNLAVETGALVTRVTFDGDRATGVEYHQEGQRREAEADAEVVLSAGAVNSPQLLMCSGVGPADHLAEHGIDVVADLPGVGRNLQDHLVTVASFESTVEFEYPPESNRVENGAFERTDPDLPAPDLQYFVLPHYFMRHGFDNPEEGGGITVAACLLRPESSGRITLRSADPTDDPAIDPQYLTDGGEEDLETLVAGIRRCREIANADALDEYRGDEVWPGGDVQTDEEIGRHVRETAHTIYHPVGTAKMGDDEMTVVDDRLRVHDLSGLRVVDASVMPTVPGGNTNAPTIAVAEKGADLILDDR